MSLLEKFRVEQLFVLLDPTAIPESRFMTRVNRKQLLTIAAPLTHEAFGDGKQLWWVVTGRCVWDTLRRHRAHHMVISMTQPMLVVIVWANMSFDSFYRISYEEYAKFVDYCEVVYEEDAGKDWLRRGF